MGTQDEKMYPPKKNRRGSTNNGARLAALGGSEKKRGEADWGTCDPQWIAAVVAAGTLKGAAVSFSLSRDQGAYGLRVLLDGEQSQLWFNQDADLAAELERVFAFFESL